MIDKKKLFKELEEEFEKTRSELGFAASFEELNEVFKIENSVFSSGFVSSSFFSRQICTRILESYRSWFSYLNSLLVPNQGSLASQTEANIFNNKEDKEIIWKLIKKIMYFSSENSIISFSRDKEREAKFIDDTLDYWKEKFSPALLDILKKVNDGWKK